MRIAICDDDAHELLHVSRLVNEYLSRDATASKTEVSIFRSSVELISQLESGRVFDLFLLDIIMPKMSGMELATEIRARDQVAKIIFLTSSAEYAVDSYAVDAFNYLLKPIQEEKLFPVLEKAWNGINQIPEQHIVVKTRDGLAKLSLYDITYVEVLGRTVHFHRTKETTLESASTFSQVVTILLMDSRFIKPHRSYIVNLDHATSLSRDGFRMTGGALVPVSRSVFKQTTQAYLNHLFRTQG